MVSDKMCFLLFSEQCGKHPSDCEGEKLALVYFAKIESIH